VVVVDTGIVLVVDTGIVVADTSVAVVVGAGTVVVASASVDVVVRAHDVSTTAAVTTASTVLGVICSGDPSFVADLGPGDLLRSLATSCEETMKKSLRVFRHRIGDRAPQEPVDHHRPDIPVRLRLWRRHSATGAQNRRRVIIRPRTVVFVAAIRS
jgi:hypothetical protein